MMVLNKRISRSIKEHLSFHISALLLTAISVFLLIILTTVGYMIKDSVSSIMENNQIEDAEFTTTTSITSDQISWIEQEFNIILEKMKYVDFNTDDYTLRVFSETEKINTYELLEGEPLSTDNEILISKDFSLIHNIQLGDQIFIFGKEYTVVGIAVRPDYLFALKDTSDVGLNKEKFGVAIVLPSVLDSIGNEKTYYGIKYTKDNHTKVRTYIASKFNPTSYTLATANRRINYPSGMGAEILSNTSSIVPVMFLMIMLIVAIVLGRMVKKEQRQIGTLSALGYHNKELIHHYINFAVFPAVLGSILGILFSLMFLKPACLYFANNLEQLNFHISAPPFILILSLLLPALLYAFTAFFTVGKMTKKNTILLLSGNATTKKDTRKIFIHSKLNFEYKFQLRTLLKNKSRSVVVFIGLLFGSILILTGFVALDSTEAMISTRIDTSGNYKYEYFLNTFEKSDKISGEKFLSYRFEVKGYNSLLLMTGIQEDSEYRNMKTKSGKQIIYDKYYITNVGAEYYGVNAGDTITLNNPLTMASYTITITDIIDDNTRSLLYTSAENVANILNVPVNYYNTIQTNDKLDIVEDNVIMFSSKDLIKEQLQKLVSTVYSLISSVIFFGVILSMITTYLTVNMLIEENENNISMLKVLGYRTKEINKLVLNTNHILFLLSFFISIPFSKELAASIFRGNIESIGNYIEPIVTLQSVLISFLVLAVSYLASLFLLKKKVYKVNMVNSLKSNRQ